MHFEHFKNIEEIGVPMVFIDRSCDEVVADKVLVDDFDGAYKATKHLIENGCKNIIHLAGPQNLEIGVQRKKGFLAALNEFNINISDYTVQVCDNYDYALKLMPEFLRRNNNIDGVFAVNDLTAIGAMKAIKSMNKKVPDDIAICGFTNSFISYIADPELTTIDQKGFEMGRHAARMLLKRIQSDENYGPVTTILNTDLIIRKSSVRKK